MNSCSKFIFIGITVFFIVIAWFPADCRSGSEIRFGVLPVLDTLPIIVAKEHKDFAKNGIDIDIVNFQSALERDAALQAGELDGYFGDLLNTLLLIGSGRNIKIVTTVFHTSPAGRMFGIVAGPNSGIKDFADLKGKQVAISRVTIIEYLLDRIIESQKKPEDYVEKLDIKKIPIRLQMLLSGKIPAALLPEPLITLAESKGGIPVIDDRILDTCLTVIALRMDLITKDATFASRFLKAYDAAVSRINRDPESFKDILVSKTRFPPQLKDHFQVPVFPEKRIPSRQDVSMARKWLEKNRMLKKPPEYDDIVLRVKR